MEWSPGFAVHVRGRYTKRTWDEDGTVIPQLVETQCLRCGTTWKTECQSGQVRRHIANFGAAHADCRAAKRPPNEAVG